jgi:hypothetical protein
MRLTVRKKNTFQTVWQDQIRLLFSAISHFELTFHCKVSVQLGFVVAAVGFVITF